MSRIKSKHTTPELAVRQALTALNIRYRLHVSSFPGKPDIVIRRLKTVIFVNGCYWHQHPGCERKSMPKTNIEYWKNKLAKNISSQKKNIQALQKLTWKVLVIWECETLQKDKLKGIIESSLNHDKPQK